MADSQEKSSISVFIETELGFDMQMYVFLCLDDLYRSLGGEGLKIDDGETYNIVTERSQFDPLAGTPFESSEKRLEPSNTTGYVDRVEVYAALRKIAKPNELDGLVRILEEKFPSKIWDNNFPRLALMQYIVNEQRDLLI